MTTPITSNEYDYHMNYNLRFPSETYKTMGLTGIENMGNTCFMSSIIHCLGNTLEFRDHFISKDYLVTEVQKRREQAPIVQSFRELLVRIWSKNGIVRPKTFRETIARSLKKYNKNQQQDSYEFLEDLLTLLEEGIKYEIEMDIQGKVNTQLDKLLDKSYREWFKHYNKSYSQLVELFDGMTYSKTSCDNCKYNSGKFEMYRGLTIEIPYDTLEANLDEYFQSSQIDDWKCEKCKKRGCTLESNLWTIPNYLIIHLKRFKCDPQTGNTYKIKNNMTYPVETLDMTKYITKDKNVQGKYVYRLYAINCHTGEINDGHYWSMARNLDTNWYIFNDMDTMQVKDLQKLNTDGAYILFYYRKFIRQSDAS